MRFGKMLLTAAAMLCITGVAQAQMADKYRIDKNHSEIEFSVRHMMLAKVKGNFTDFSGEIMFDESNIANSSVKVVIVTASIDTDNEGRNKHLRSPDFFGVEKEDGTPEDPKYLEITFESTRVEKKDDKYLAHGNLNMHGVEKQVTITFEVFGPVKGRRGNVIGAEGHLTINRKDFNINYHRLMDSGGLVVSDEVDIELMVEAGIVTE